MRTSILCTLFLLVPIMAFAEINLRIDGDFELKYIFVSSDAKKEEHIDAILEIRNIIAADRSHHFSIKLDSGKSNNHEVIQFRIDVDKPHEGSYEWIQVSVGNNSTSDSSIYQKEFISKLKNLVFDRLFPVRFKVTTDDMLSSKILLAPILPTEFGIGEEFTCLKEKELLNLSAKHSYNSFISGEPKYKYSKNIVYSYINNEYLLDSLNSTLLLTESKDEINGNFSFTIKRLIPKTQK